MMPRKSAGATAPGIVLERVFDAPREQVWRAWTEPALLKRWWAPKGWSTPACKVDLRPGGAFHFCMRSPEGRDIWGLGVYREVVAPERLAYVDSFADADGNPVPPARYGMSPEHPHETLVSVTFAALGGRTKVTLRHDVPASVKEHEGTRQGWTEMLEQLAQTLEA